MLHLVDIAHAFGPQELFTGVSWHLAPQQRVGLVGPNGVGKTTLFRLMTGELRPDQGEVLRRKHLRIGTLAQEVSVRAGQSALELVMEARGDLHDLEAARTELEQAMSGGTHDPELLERYAQVQARYDLLGGYALESEAARILNGLGFSTEDMHREATGLSGGWLMRIALARLLLQAPDLLLLDEPTNHLDLESLLWFEQFIEAYPGTVVIISHDRALLNHFATSIAELGPRGVALYEGNFDAYVIAREERRELQEAAVRNQAKVVAKAERFIERFRAKNTKATLVQSRIKALARVERLEAPDDQPRAIRFRFPQPPRSGKDVVKLEGVAKRYGALTVYDSLDLLLRRGERVALVGPNGAGKSTLMKLIAGQISPDAGELTLGAHVDRAYFAQHQTQALDVSRTVLGELESASDTDTFPLCRGLLGAFRFSGESVDKRVGVLSGGEKARLAIAKMLLKPANLLLLDEPTNHLDMQTREVLAAALEEFTGTLVIISHDRHFINAVGNVVLEVRGGVIERFPGNYDDYLYKKQQLASAEEHEAPSAAVQTEGGGRRERKRREAELRNAHHRETRELKAQEREIEDAISKVEQELEGLDQRMIEPSFYDDPAEMKRIWERKALLEGEQETLLARWEELAQHLEGLEATYKRQLESLG